MDCWDALCEESNVSARGIECPLHLALPVVQSFGHLLKLHPDHEGAGVALEGGERLNGEGLPILLDDLLWLQHTCNLARCKVNACKVTNDSIGYAKT